MKLFFGGEKPKNNAVTPEYKESNYPKDERSPMEHDPHANPLEGTFNNPASDVIDPENFYNVEGFEDKDSYNEEAAEMLPGAEVGELMEKYGLEEFELKDLLKNCEAYLNNQKKSMPLSDKKEVEKLALFYREYLAAKNEYGLPFSEEELAKVSPEKQEELANLYSERESAVLEIAAANQLEADGVAKENSGVVYSTIEQNNLGNKKPQLIFDLGRLNKKISSLEKNILNKEPKNQEKKEVDPWKEVPEYSAEELALQESCLNYSRNRKNPHPEFADGKALNDEQITEMLKEILPKSRFSEEIHQGRRQLVFMDNLGSKRIKYVFSSEKLPSGEYHFEADPSRFFISKNNPNFAIAPIRMVIPAEKPAVNNQERLQESA
ncbi:MAG: hypothetical protein NT165_03960 [Candidatus Falkowbacteria bacterium]|nr:hypothetical protein [Candidatus Falkowbacteria bacterium]